MVPIQNVKMTASLIRNTRGTETEISVPAAVLGPQLAGMVIQATALVTSVFFLK